MGNNRLVAGLDIGTSKIAVIVAEVDQYGHLNVIGVGNSSSEGLKRGNVINIEKTVQAIRKATQEAELMAGTHIDSVYVGIAGDHIQGINSRGVVAISNSDNEITYNDISRVIDAAKAVALPTNCEIIHILPQEFIVDKQGGIKDPIGMSGIRLEAEVHIVVGGITYAQNIYKSVTKAGINVRDIVLEPLASSYSVLGKDEKEQGVVLIDIGGGTTDIAMFFEGSIRHTASVALGGINVTSDIALGLRTPIEQAEEIKIKYGIALQSKVEDEMISVPGIGGRPAREISRSVLAAIIQPRMEEILSLALSEIERSDYFDLMSAGVVLTGGGALLEGTVELSEEIFNMPAKLGVPLGFGGGLADSARNPIYSTGVGLVMYGVRNKDEKILENNNQVPIGRIKKTVEKWIKEFF
jgi:cell division protein FtsA